MTYMGARIIYKSVGHYNEVEWDREDYTVTTLYKGKILSIYRFDKFYKSVNFFARLKKVKDIKEADEIVTQYQ